jgi:uncharacterized protein
MTPILSGYHHLDPTLLLVVERQAEMGRARRGARPRSGRHRSTPAWSALIATIVGIVVLASGLSSGRVSAMPPNAWIDAHGIFELESGIQMTLFGRHPMVELAGEEAHLVADGPDRFIADMAPFDVITLHRNDHGQVESVTLARPGEGMQRGKRVEPFVERLVTFRNGDVELSGSLLIPASVGPHPAVAIVHGAEFGTRETYRLMATHLARRGVAAVFYDKRGTGESGGSFSSASFDDLTADALAAAALLRAQTEIDPDRVGLMGMSQGGWIIARAASQTEDVAFLVALSASGFTPAQQAAWLTGSMLAVRGFDQGPINASARAWGMMYSSLDLIDAGILSPMPHLPGFWFHALDPHLDTAGLWEQVRQPVLGLWGELDCQVPAYDSLSVVRGALERGPNRAYELRILPGADHGLALVEPCEREIGASHGGRFRYADGFLSAPAEWIHALEPASEHRVVGIPPERTSSLLGWHQSAETRTPWFGSMAAQLTVLPVLLAFFGSVALAGPVRRAVGLARRRPAGGRSSGGWWNLTGLIGLVAILAGTLALIELLMLADLRSAPLVGGPSVDGTSPVFAATGVLSGMTLVLGAVALMADARAGRVRRVRAAITVAGTVLLGAWAIYWGFIPLPGVG